MFAPMTSQNEYARFEAETREHARHAEHLMNAQTISSFSVVNDLARRFTNWALKRRQPAEPAMIIEPLVTQAPECC